MHTHITLGRVFGIRIGLDYSWFLIALLIAFSLAAQFHHEDPQWGAATIWSMAIATSIFFFVCLVLHELSHSLVARSRGMKVRAITLFALGGVAQIEEGASDAKSEFWMAIVGPLTSAAIGVVCLVAVSALGGPKGLPLPTMIAWLGYINLGLAFFNMIPGYPLDGGRVLRAILWWKGKDMDRATRWAARAGQAVGILFIVFGILRFFAGAGIGGLWIAFIGWFLLQVAGQSYVEVGLKHRLENVHVADVMARDCATVDGFTNLRTFVEEHLLHSSARCFLVTENGTAAGLVTPEEVRQIDRARWPYTVLSDVMRPLENLQSVSPETPLAQALKLMSGGNVNQLPVLSHGHLEGVLSRAQILSYLQTRAALQI